MRYFLIDAFAETPFQGNPAMVCVLDKPLSEATMMALAREFALSETAFVRREGGVWGLRWFSPAMEIPLCGHGTLATARALSELGLASEGELRFQTLAGELVARIEGELIELEFPARPAEAVRDLVPERGALMALASELHGIIVTGSGDARAASARGSGEMAAISSRFFAPEAGVFEDPVTGSAHCALAPYWGPILGRERFLAWQASSRGGLVRVTLAGDRVRPAGGSVVVAEGTLRPEALEGAAASR